MNVFDIVGPVMIGPSSSHTAGAVRIGRIAGALLEGEPVRAHILLHGSFAKTYRGHGTDKALVAGIMGMAPSDIRIRQSLEIAKERGLDVVFGKTELEGAHPNTVVITLKDAKGRTVKVQGASVGGGNILISEINGMKVEVTGQQDTLLVLHRDVPGVIAHVTNYIAAQGVNIGNFKLTRSRRGETAMMTIEMDGEFSRESNEGIEKLPNVIRSIILRPE
ncbi:L-serine ammonia-lyase, iron-sulfur-dependent, subunit beta [Caproiciproducens galactitolivorans]|uniref:L-serine deaminase n=1 Tax=Caproiciproducens galactitolivorans TaxID=642589 RepID=A0A4Z0YDQ0_9FIRM|nr:L-serine ammonia-lyase, iron-sulfur-dependent subunit beta [Caproiciproducens galactitolivorans]QEY35249.1 L-serine ammonia-lyase, iron-sulfur-dependent, subunit beta [Caproiciproducens galactitolivorans]TGJ76943.1 L-serine dehydratase, beta chain [Caproiciproducens galactitolivorans]